MSTNAVKRWLKQWLEDTIHYFKTGESTIHCEAGHRVYISSWGGTRVDPGDFLRSYLERNSQRHKPLTNPQPTMSTSRDENLKKICDYLKDNPDRLMALLEEIPDSKRMERFPMEGLRQDYFKYDSRVYRREAKGSGYQWSSYSDYLSHPDPDCRWRWHDLSSSLLAEELESRYLRDCVGLCSSTFIKSDNECTYTPDCQP